MLLWVFIRFYYNFQAQDKNSHTHKHTHTHTQKKEALNFYAKTLKCKFILRRIYHKLLNYEILIRKRTNQGSSYSYKNTFFFK